MPDAGPGASQRAAKRTFDILVALLGLVASAPVVLAAVVIATLDTRETGLFTQTRIGKDGRPFRLYKIRTMRTSLEHASTVTVDRDPRITRSGRIMRKLKIDELPQLVNVLLGEMSLVGPRPDVAGFADQLDGADRIVLAVRPGITGPAALAYRHEEDLLAAVEDPERHNREVIWPDKVRINRAYVENYSFRSDLRYLTETAKSVLPRKTS